MSDHDVTIGEVAAYELGVETGRAELQQRVAELEAALRALDRVHRFAETLKTEDWGLYEDAAIPAVREAYALAANALKETGEP